MFFCPLTDRTQEKTQTHVVITSGSQSGFLWLMMSLSSEWFCNSNIQFCFLNSSSSSSQVPRDRADQVALDPQDDLEIPEYPVGPEPPDPSAPRGLRVTVIRTPVWATMLEVRSLRNMRKLWSTSVIKTLILVVFNRAAFSGVFHQRKILSSLLCSSAALCSLLWSS